MAGGTAVAAWAGGGVRGEGGVARAWRRGRGEREREGLRAEIDTYMYM